MSRGAVLLFFVISGYVIGLTNKAPYSGVNARGYLARRATRLIPIYIVGLLLGLISAPNTEGRVIIGNALFLQNPSWGITPLPGNLPVWSLHNEVFYYLAFLLVWKFCPRLDLLLVVLVGISLGDWFFGGPFSIFGSLASGGIYWLMGLYIAWMPPERYSGPTLAYVLFLFATTQLWPGVILLRGLGFAYTGVSTLWLADLFSLPGVLAVFTSVVELRAPFDRTLRLFAIAIPTGTCCLLAAMGRLFENAPWTLAAAAVLAGFGFLFFKRDRSVLERALRMLAPVGFVSYALYLFHVPFAAIVGAYYPWRPSHVGYIGGVATWLSLTFSVAWLCERWIQPKVTRFFRRF